MAQINNAYEEGLRRYNEQNFQTASAFLKRAMETAQNAPDTEEEMFYLRVYYGNCLFQMGHLQHAEEYHRQTLRELERRAGDEADSGKTLVNQNLASVLYSQGQKDATKALEKYEEGVSLLEAAQQEVDKQGDHEVEMLPILETLAQIYASIGKLKKDSQDLYGSKKHYTQAVQNGKHVIRLQQHLVYDEADILSTKYQVANDLHSAWEFDEAAEVYQEIQAHLEKRQIDGVTFPNLNFDAAKCQEIYNVCRSHGGRKTSIKTWRRPVTLLAITEQLRRKSRARGNWYLLCRWALLKRVLMRWRAQRRITCKEDLGLAPTQADLQDSFEIIPRCGPRSLPGAFDTEKNEHIATVLNTCLQFPETVLGSRCSARDGQAKPLEEEDNAAGSQESLSKFHGRLMEPLANGEAMTISPEINPGAEEGPPLTVTDCRGSGTKILSHFKDVTQTIKQTIRPRKPLSESSTSRDELKYPAGVPMLHHIGLLDFQPAQLDEDSQSWISEFYGLTHIMGVWSNDESVPRVKVAILDTGIDAQHPYVKKKWKRDRLKDRGYRDFVSGDKDVNSAQDEHGHGTHCAGSILRYASRADLYVARIAKSRESCQVDKDFSQRVTKALEYAFNEWNVDIVSMSFGMTSTAGDLKRLITEYYGRGKVIFAAASNSGNLKGVAFPAPHRDVFCIHAYDRYARPAPYTPDARPDKNDFSILGNSVYSTWPDFRDKDLYGEERSSDIELLPGLIGTWKYMSGTSMATPLAVALAANILGYYRAYAETLPRLSNYEVVLHSFKGMSLSNDRNGTLVPWRGRLNRFRDCSNNRAIFHTALNASLWEQW